MVKRIIIGSITGIIIITASIFYFVKENEPVVTSLYRAVPLDAALIIDIKNFKDFHRNLISGNQLWDELSRLPVFNKFNQQLRLIDSLQMSNTSINQLLSQNHSILISGHPFGKDDIQLVYYFKIEAEKDFRQIDKLIKSYESNTIDFSSHKYEHATIRDITFAERRGENFSYTWSHGLMILSKSSILVEDAVRQLVAKESILDQKGFNELIKTAGKSALVNFYLNFEHFPRIGLKLIHPKFREELNFIKHFGNWIELDLNLKSDVLILNGFSYADAAHPGFELLFKNQKPQKLEIFSKIPIMTNTFAVLGISNFDQYMKDYKLFLEANGNVQGYKANIQALKSNYNIDLVKSFHELFEQEAGIVFANVSDDTLANQAFSIIRTKNKEDAEKMLNGFITEYANENNLKFDDLLIEQTIDKDLKIKIWSLPFGNIPALLFGHLFSVSENQYCILAGNYLVFGNSTKALIKYLQNITQNSTLGTDLEFNNFSEYFASQSNFFFYNKPSFSINNFYPNFLKQDIILSLAMQREHFSRMQAMVYQFNISDNNLIYNNIFVKYTSETSVNMAKTTWESQLEANVACKPVILKNYVKNPIDIFVQDAKNQLYLVNDMGRILWKIKLPEPIISDIFQLDFYKNGKLQILFNTRTWLYMLDRKGNSVETFPVKLQVPATNGLALFDYEKNRNYRIFVAGNDQKIYSYDKEGKIIPGWEFNHTETEVTQPVQHFRIEGKDFLVFNDSQRLYVVDRKGTEVMKPVKIFLISVNNKAGLVNARSLKDAKFVLTDTTGKVYFIGLDGKIKNVDYGKYPDNHWFDVCDIDADGVKDLIFAWEHNLKVISQKGKELFSITIDRPISFRPGFYEFSGKNYKIGLVSAENEKVYLYDRSGALCKGFPLKGNTQFSIELLNNSENKFNLIVGSNNNFLYHYSVQ